MSDYPMLISNKLHSFRNFRMLLSFCSYDKNRKSLSVKQLFLIKILELCTKMA
jgi:hypothetical protein